MSSQGKASNSATPDAPKKTDVPAKDVKAFRVLLREFFNEVDDQGRKWSSARWGVYAFYDYDGEPIYVGQTNEKLRSRIGRHLTNQRTDAVAMRILDVFEVAEIQVWPLWEYEKLRQRDDPAAYAAAKQHLNQCEYTAYLKAIDESQYGAILNEVIPPASEPCDLPPSLRAPVISEEMRAERDHKDIRIARRAETISRLAAVARERGEVSPGLRRALAVQAFRLAYLSSAMLAYVEGRPQPDPTAVDITKWLGSVLEEKLDPDNYDHDDIG
jgi:hypothetical protein